MIDRRIKVLSAAVKLTIVIGLALAAIPFVSSLNPSELANELTTFERIDISDFPRNTHRLIQARDSQQWENEGATNMRPGRAWLVIHDNSGAFHVFGLPTWEGKVLMPRSFWGQFEGLCEDLGPSSKVAVIDRTTQIQCNDQDNIQHSAKYWFWSLNGENLTRELADMDKIRSERQLNDLVIFDAAWNLN